MYGGFYLMQASCGKLITCWDLLQRPCLREEGHIPGHCNPFSNSYPEEELVATEDSSTKLYRKVLQAAGLEPNKLTA